MWIDARPIFRQLHVLVICALLLSCGGDRLQHAPQAYKDLDHCLSIFGDNVEELCDAGLYDADSANPHTDIIFDELEQFQWGVVRYMLNWEYLSGLRPFDWDYDFWGFAEPGCEDLNLGRFTMHSCRDSLLATIPNLPHYYDRLVCRNILATADEIIFLADSLTPEECEQDLGVFLDGYMDKEGLAP